MHEHPLQTRFAEATYAQSAWIEGSTEVAALEQHASAGCSVCARTLVNARETAVDLALAEAPVEPSEGRRRALLGRVRGKLAARKTAFLFEAAPAEVRVLDPSAVVAHKHIADPVDAARIDEIDALHAAETGPGGGSARMLSQLARFLDFSVYFITIVRGERATYRTQRGLPEGLRVFRELRREMSYCTHCISGEAPLIVENALTEPFFRGNKAATRFGVAAYAGVPLRTASGIVIGTLCALDFAPRAIAAETTGLLEVFARRAVAEIERVRTPSLLGEVIEASSEHADLHTERYFQDLVAAELARAAPGDGGALVTIRTSASPDAILGWLGEHETAGRIGDGVFGVFLPGTTAEAAEQRAAGLRSVAAGAAVGFSILPAKSTRRV